MIFAGVIYHSGIAELRACIDSLTGQSVDRSRILVVDTSASGSARGVSAETGVTWFDGSRNGGYAWAVNRVFERAPVDASAVIACNSDVQFLPLSVSRLARCALESRGICFPLQVHSDGSPAMHSVHPILSRSVMYMDMFRLGTRSYRGRRDRDRYVRWVYSHSRSVPLPRNYFGSGAVICASVEAMKELGGLDEDFHLYCEDMMLGAAVQETRVRACLCGDALVVHEGGVRTSGVDRRTLIEGLASTRLAWRKLGIGAEVEVSLVEAAGMLLRTVLASSPRDRSEYAAAFRFCFENLLGTYGPPYGQDGTRLQAWIE